MKAMARSLFSYWVGSALSLFAHSTHLPTPSDMNALAAISHRPSKVVEWVRFR